MNKKAIIVLVLVLAVIAGVVATQVDTTQAKAGDTAKAASSSNVINANNTGKPIAEKVEHPVLETAPLDSDYVIGEPGAPVTLIEYASLSCPHCANFHNKVLPKLKKEYISKGKLRYILRQFPLNEPALLGAMLAHCAGEQGGQKRYYQFNDVLFGSQKKWAFDSNFRKSLQIFAEVGGMSVGDFDNCLKDKDREQLILQTRKTAADHLGVNATPYIFLNGRPHRGNKTYKAVKRDIDYLLGAK